MEKWLNVEIYAGRSLCQAVESTEQNCQTVSSKFFLVIKAVDGVDSIMDYLKELF
jgi:hypothetical protein